MLYKPRVEICGNPTSRGSRVTPCRPTWLAKSTPRFSLTCPPLTRIQPKRISFTTERPNRCVWLTPTFRALVPTSRPKPGTSVSCSTLVPNGCTSSASNVLKRAKSWSPVAEAVVDTQD